MTTKSPFGGPVGATKRITPVQEMGVNGLVCELHMPKATESRHDAFGQEVVSHLAPYAPTAVINVSDLPNAPEDWVKSDPVQGIASYLLRAKTGHMVWFNFNRNERNTHHVAAVISSQGVNALTGQKMTPPVRLEQYSEVCPVHGCRFEGHGRFCPQCGIEWPGQNYIATTSCRSGAFWRDGFRGQDGKTREFIFTADESRGVAANLIGNERVNAFGIALFTSREPKPRPAVTYRGCCGDGFLGGGGLESFGATRGMRSLSFAPEVGAGALVSQEVESDMHRLDFWKREPEAVICLYYLGEAAYDALVGAAVQRPSEGFLNGIPVGNK